MTNPLLLGMCKKERRKFEEMERTCNQNCEAYDDIFQISGIPYSDHNYADHTMDLYYPHNPEGLPIIISIHGGGLISGNKEFNRPFCCELARTGFIVLAIEFPKAPETPIGAILNDVLLAEAKAIEAAAPLKPDTNHVFVIGDSGGAFLTMYTTAMIKNNSIADDFGIKEVPDIPITALGFISGLFYTTANDFYGAFYKRVLYSKSAIKFDIPKHVNPDCQDIAGVLPPCYLLTSSGDFLQDYTLRFSKALHEYDTPHELRYVKDDNLKHDFPVMDTNTISAKGAIAEMTRMFKKYIDNE